MNLYQIIERLYKDDVEILTSVGNKVVMQVSKSTKRKPAFIKIAITDEMADMFLSYPMKAMAAFIALPARETKKMLMAADDSE